MVEEELALLQEVAEQLADLPPPDLSSEHSLVEELQRLRTLLVERSEEKDRVALLDQWTRQSALLRQLQESRARPSVDPRSPYFAHLRLQEGERIQDLCLGKATRIEGGLRIVDWRNAPISRIFYRYDQGEDYEEELAGRRREGRVLARRTVTIRDGALERIDAPEGTFHADSAAKEGWRELAAGRPKLAGGEGSALRAHGEGAGLERRLGTDFDGARRRTDKRLPDIAGLIDPDQFSLITRPAAGFLVIRGMAGSGKTTVALHRIAYLAYDDEAIDSARTLVVMFSQALRDYVGHVLPALGVRNVQVRTFHDWAAEQSKRLYPRLPRERSEHAPSSVHRLKLHPAMGFALEEQVRTVSGPRTREQALDDWTSVLTIPHVLEAAFARVAPGEASATEIAEVCAWNRARHDELRAWLEGDRSLEVELDPEDDALLLRAWQLRVGPLEVRRGRPLEYRHVAIDEVQDFSPLEVRVLLDCLDRRRSITLAGDTQQHVMQDAGFTSWTDFFEHLQVQGTEVHTLRVSYRSTQEITEFAMDLLGDLREDEGPPETTRSGPPVELFRFNDHGACVTFLAEALKELSIEEPLASIAVLTPSEEASALYHEGFVASDVDRVRRVERQNFTFSPGIEVTEIEQVKGLEFDYVIIVDVNAEDFPESARFRRLLHMGATRAVHQLWMTSIGSASPIVEKAFARR